VGLYGKLPVRGDFVQRNLPREFTEPWDDWLQQALAGSREQLGERWLRSYLTSPVWRFALSGGLCGSQAAAGVMIPSVDRVGRYFPLTVAALLPPSADPLALAEYTGGWYEQIEALILEGLDDDLDFEHFTERVNTLPLPQSTTDKVEKSIGSQQNWHCPMPDLAAMPQLRAKLMPLLLRRTFGNYSTWWTQGSEQVTPCVLLCTGLPTVQGFAALLAGQWEQSDWWSASLPVTATTTDEPHLDPLGEL
jgi:type VI secretion system protein ImpM